MPSIQLLQVFLRSTNPIFWIIVAACVIVVLGNAVGAGEIEGWIAVYGFEPGLYQCKEFARNILSASVVLDVEAATPIELWPVWMDIYPDAAPDAVFNMLHAIQEALEEYSPFDIRDYFLGACNSAGPNV